MGSIRFRTNGSLYIDFRDQLGNRVRESVDTTDMKLARQILKKRELEVLESKFFDKRKQERVSFRDFAKKALNYILERRRSREFFEVLTARLVRSLGDKFLSRITPRDVAEYQSMRAGEVSKSSVNRELAVLKRIFNLGIKWSVVDNNPVTKVEFFPEPKNRVRFLKKDEMQRLLSNCHGELKHIVKTALMTGMRRGELLGLRWVDIDFDNNIIILDRTKNGDIREIPLSRELRGIFLIKSKGKLKEDYVFSKSDGSRYKDVRVAFKTALKLSEISGFRFHDLRHTFASQMVMAGVDILTIKEILGHKEIGMTMRYAHLVPKHKEEAIYKMESSTSVGNVDNFGHNLGTKPHTNTPLKVGT